MVMIGPAFVGWPNSGPATLRISVKSLQTSMGGVGQYVTHTQDVKPGETANVEAWHYPWEIKIDVV
jgi:hypothetical protein